MKPGYQTVCTEDGCETLVDFPKKLCEEHRMAHLVAVKKAARKAYALRMGWKVDVLGVTKPCKHCGNPLLTENAWQRYHVDCYEKAKLERQQTAKKAKSVNDSDVKKNNLQKIKINISDEKLKANIDRIVFAARQEDYNKYCPEKFLSTQP